MGEITCLDRRSHGRVKDQTVCGRHDQHQLLYCIQSTTGRGESCIIIDPGDNASYLAKLCRDEKLKPEAILLTHGHFDHMMAADELRRTFQIPFMPGEKEVELLADPDMNVSKLGGECVSLNVDRLLRDGETLDFLGEEWKVLFTPGHTGGGVCYYLKEQKILFSGDTLFDSLWEERICLREAAGRSLIQ